MIAAKNPCWHSLSAFHNHPAARRYVRSTSAASRRDAERARFKVQVPNIASNVFLSLKSLALKAYLKVRLEISDLGRLPPLLLFLPPRPAHTAAPHLKKGGKFFWGLFFRFFTFPSCNQNFASKKHRTKSENQGFWFPKPLPKPFQNRYFFENLDF